MTSWTFFKDEWIEGNPPIMGPMDHAPWLGSTVFDGARYFEGVSPDLDRHCQRIVNSAKTFALDPMYQAEEIIELSKDGIARFDKDAALYIRPMYWAQTGFVDVDPESTTFCLTVHDMAMPDVSTGASITCSQFRRPSVESAPTDAKASCHYPNSARVLREAHAKGFNNAIMLDPLGNVAELATANIFYVKDGEVHTPVPNGTFLNGITRQRVIKLLTSAGIKVHERTLSYGDFLKADEIFSTNNYGKVMPITKIDDQDLQPGPVYTKARELYWEFAHAG